MASRRGHRLPFARMGEPGIERGRCHARQQQAPGIGAQRRMGGTHFHRQAERIGAFFLGQHQHLVALQHGKMAAFAHIIGQRAHQWPRGRDQRFIGRVDARQLEQLERQGIAAVGGITPDIAAPFQAGEHAKQFARLAIERARQLRLRHRHGLIGQVFDDIQPLFQGRHGIFPPPLVGRQGALGKALGQAVRFGGRIHHLSFRGWSGDLDGSVTHGRGRCHQHVPRRRRTGAIPGESGAGWQVPPGWSMNGIDCLYRECMLACKQQ